MFKSLQKRFLEIKYENIIILKLLINSPSLDELKKKNIIGSLKEYSGPVI